MSRAHRIFDVVGAFAGLAAFAPAMAVIAVAVLIDDGRPVAGMEPVARLSTHIDKIRLPFWLAGRCPPM